MIRRHVITAVVLMLTPVAASAQWLEHRTPNLPRTKDGKPELTAPAPRSTDNRPDFSGIWNTPFLGLIMPVDDGNLTARAKALMQERQEVYRKDRPYYQCLPSGPEVVPGYRRIIQTPTLITIVHETLLNTRFIFMDGRALEGDPERTWMGYSVGRWEGDTLVVESFGFNDRTWLDAHGLPHTEALRTTERYTRRTVGQLDVELTATDPETFASPVRIAYSLELRPGTEMVEAVCEHDSSNWVGRRSDIERDVVVLSRATLQRYVGVYRGTWVARERTVRVQLEGDTLYANGVLGDRVRLVPQSETHFSGTDGLTYLFDPAGRFLEEVHQSGNWIYPRQPEK